MTGLYDRIAVYIAAHQDDWQLFMDPRISADIVDPRCKTIIIHTTAGDAGLDKKYWYARECAAVDSLVFRVSYRGHLRVVKKMVVAGDKSISMVNAGNCSIYFLRLPDGGMHGEGFERYQYQSMNKIRLHAIEKIITVDHKNEFSSFEEIGALLNMLIKREQKECGMVATGNICLNFPEYDSVLSPNDHNDHLNTALLTNYLEIYRTARKCAFVHYDIQHSASDLKGIDLFWKIGMFSVYHQAVLNRYGHSTIGETPEYSAWCRKDARCREIS
jgi:hypothetical protein